MQLESWLRSYHPEELFDKTGSLLPELAELAPKGARRMGANPQANGGLLLQDLQLPDFCDYAVELRSSGRGRGRRYARLGRFLRDVISLNSKTRNFRIFGPDETMSNRLGDVFKVTERQWDAQRSQETTTWRLTAAWWKCLASISARAGSRVTC